MDALEKARDKAYKRCAQLLIGMRKRRLRELEPERKQAIRDGTSSLPRIMTRNMTKSEYAHFKTLGVALANILKKRNRLQYDRCCNEKLCEITSDSDYESHTSKPKKRSRGGTRKKTPARSKKHRVSSKCSPDTERLRLVQRALAYTRTRLRREGGIQ